MLDAFWPLESLRPTANRLERHLEIVRQVAHILDTDGSARQVRRTLGRYLRRLEKQAPRRGRGAHTGRFVDNLVKVYKSYKIGLFHTYDHPEIPRTSNAIEGFFGSTKRSLRSTTGRASTAGGKMESCPEFLVQAHTLTGLMPKAELKQHLNAVPDSTFVNGKRELLRAREPARERRSIKRRLGDFLDSILAAWEASGQDPSSPGP